MVSYIISDLEFILNQIKIAEAHAAGQPLYGPGGLIPAYNVAWGLRTVDGSYNHLLPGQEQWGASDRPFPSLMDPQYRPAEGTPLDFDGPGGMPAIPTQANYNPSNNPNSYVVDSSVRTISNLLVDQTLDNPAAILTALQRSGAAGDHMAITTTIMAAYQPLKPLFKAVDDAADEAAEARAAAEAANAPEGSPLDLAADAAEAALVVAETALADARTLDADGAGPGVSFDALLAANGVALSGANVELPNVAPDEGLSAPFNSWFTLFGQFFDHGLDLVNKGGSGTVFIPLEHDDPLYDAGPDNIPGNADDGHTNFMVLTRATTSPGVDGIWGTADDVKPVNTTTSFVDQNQTYTSHPSHQVFLRQYVMTLDGPAATGKLIEGGNGGMANWGELKEYARTMLGIQLTDADVGKVPLLRTDPYGNFIPGSNGFPQVITAVGTDGIPNTADDVVIEGDPAANGGLGISIATALRTNHAFLADIAHNAVPTGIEDGDITIGLTNPGNLPNVYDDELLDAHFIAGDGRVNENIGLTAVHHVFHAEHNRLVDHTKEVIVTDAQAMVLGGATQVQARAFLNEWLAVDVATVPTTMAEINALVWDGERIFQAAKLGTEMQYQHLVFEEFARKIHPAINTFLVPDGFDTTMNPDIVAEFAHVVYRFGHSMLTETVDRFDADFQADHVSLIQAFLNPTEFNGTPGPGSIDDGIVAGDIIRGMTRQTGNHIDEFVTSALRNNLLGLPLDLATINLARGRDTGVPSLNAARRDFYARTDQDARLKPYESWVEFAGNLKNEASIINFIAAYGTHDLITSQTTLIGRRDAALSLIGGTAVGTIPAGTDLSDADDFLNGAGAYAGDLGGLEHVDLWIGGLAEKTMPFGGMLGSTFTFVFETQMENLQSGDRFYYLQRLDGLHLFGELEAASFAAMIERNTNATHLPSDVFSNPGLILEVEQSRQFNDSDGDGVLDSLDPVGDGILTQLVIRGDNPFSAGVDTNSLKYTGGDHVVLGGTDQSDVLAGGIGDDTLHGDGARDYLEGGFGNDIMNGGAGDDIIKDIGGDENIKGGDGNDAIHAGPGLDLVLGGRGQDFIVLGTDEGSEVFGQEGDDFILGNKNAERILGNEGNDWLETGTFDGAPGDNFDEIFAHDGIDGNDVFLGDGGFDEFIGEGGDDIMVGSPGRGKMAGMSGFDWATYKDNGSGVNADLSIPIIFDEAPTIPASAALDEYGSMEGLSGSAYNDILRGQNEGADAYLPGVNGGFLGSALDAQGIALISGLQQVLGTGVTAFTGGDIILGGDGSDTITGQAGNDIIDGDKWLNVRISVRDANEPNVEIGSVDSMTELMTDIFNGTINPSQLKIVREVLDLSEAEKADDIDVAVFSGNLADYDISGANGTLMVVHARGTETDGTDRLRNIERLQFADQVLNIQNVSATGQPVIADLTPTEGQQLTLDASAIADFNGLGAFSYQWQSSTNGTTWNNIAGATTATFTPDDNAGMVFGDQAGQLLRVAVSFTDGVGNPETVLSAPTAPVGVNWNGNDNPNMLNGTAGDDIASGQGAGDVLNGNAGADLLNGNGGADTLIGGIGNDTLNGAAGADSLNGGAGLDAMTGGGGNDTYFVDNLGDTVIENPGEGLDTVNASIDYVLAPGSSIEILSIDPAAGAAAINLTGNSLAQNIFGNAGNNVLRGGGGDDWYHGGAGNDDIYVDSANDVVFENAGEGMDRVYSNVTYVLAAAANVEILSAESLASTSAINLTGSSVAQNIFGNAGNNILRGGGGDDWTHGGAGNDSHFVDSANDVVFESAGAGTDTVFSSISYVLAASADIEILSTGSLAGTAAINLTGNALSQTLWGNAGNNVLAGGGGDDSFIGGGGNDGYFVDSQSDVVIESAGQGTDTVYASASYALAAGASIEIMSTGSLAATTAINLTGNGLSQEIWGNAGANEITGGAGNDILLGGGGADIFIFGPNSGMDRIIDLDADPAGTQDMLDISLYGTAASDFTSEVSVVQSGANTVVMIAGNVITLQGVNASSVTEEDFIFA